jgi:tRNA(Ile2) C34 agmatinyltransferase TiaS
MGYIMTGSIREQFIKEVITIIDRWSFEQCALCDEGTMVSIEGMLDFRCTKCGETMNPLNYLGAIAKSVYNYRDQLETDKESIED